MVPRTDLAGAAPGYAILWGPLANNRHLFLSRHTEEKESTVSMPGTSRLSFGWNAKALYNWLFLKTFHSIEEEGNEIVSEQKEAKLFISY